jgi:3-carboxy-cis,cis-muconate cycloisomerase
MLRLGRELGRGRAHDVVYGACKEAIEQGKTLLDALKRDQEVSGRIGEEELAELCDPRNYLGASGLMVDQVVDGGSHESKETRMQGW